WPGFFKDNRCGFWVSQDIELSSRGHIAGVVPAAHQGDSANALNQLWVHAREKRDIGQRTGRNNDHGTGFILRDNLGNQVDRVDIFQRDTRFRQLRAIEARIAVDFIGDKLRAHQRTRGTSGKRNAGDTRNACYRARIGGDFSRVWLPVTVVTAKSSRLGLPCARSMAMASSWPGSQSRMIFCAGEVESSSILAKSTRYLPIYSQLPGN